MVSQEPNAKSHPPQSRINTNCASQCCSSTPYNYAACVVLYGNPTAPFFTVTILDPFSSVFAQSLTRQSPNSQARTEIRLDLPTWFSSISFSTQLTFLCVNPLTILYSLLRGSLWQFNYLRNSFVVYRVRHLMISAFQHWTNCWIGHTKFKSVFKPQSLTGSGCCLF